MDVRLELGGDDQWSNIIGGVELIRKADDKEAYGMTFTLVELPATDVKWERQKAALCGLT